MLNIRTKLFWSNSQEKPTNWHQKSLYIISWQKPKPNEFSLTTKIQVNLSSMTNESTKNVPLNPASISNQSIFASTCWRLSAQLNIWSVTKFASTPKNTFYPILFRFFVAAVCWIWMLRVLLSILVLIVLQLLVDTKSINSMWFKHLFKQLASSNFNAISFRDNFNLSGRVVKMKDRRRIKRVQAFAGISTLMYINREKYSSCGIPFRLG